MLFARVPAAFLALTAAATMPGWASAAGSGNFTMTGAPPEFTDLEHPREMLVDLYFGKRRVGEAWIFARPGWIKFRDPDAVRDQIPGLKPLPEIGALLSGELADHAALACATMTSQRCGTLEPTSVGAIFDEGKLRLDLFVHPKFLELAGPSIGYLPMPAASFSMTSSIGGAIAGSTTGPTNYNFQSRTIIGHKAGRVRTSSSVASDLGFVLDDLVAEVDTQRHRYSGGLFWAPGVDFTGRRRIAGFGFATQFDTREESDSLGATPLIVFLNQPARVEILIDGRLVTSASYEAGNRSLDSSSLPSGSYSLVLRIREPGGNVREERRFFVKNAEIAPLGQPVYFAYAGLLADARRGTPVSVSRDFYYQVGAAHRLSTSLALDAAVLGTQNKVIAQVGGWFITDIARVRAAALASLDGDKGLLLQMGSTGMGPLSFSLDLRRVWSASNIPLIPLPSQAENFDSLPLTGGQVLSGSYTQAIGSLTYSLGGAFLGITGSYRRDRALKSDYSIGPSFNWPVLNRGGFQLIMTADAQRSHGTTAGFAGVRILYAGGGYSTLSSAGFGTLRHADGKRTSRHVGSLSAQWFHAGEDRTQVGLEAALTRDVESSVARASAQASTRLGSARAELFHSLGVQGGTQYGLSFQTGVAVGGSAVGIGGRDLNQSAIIATLDGSAGTSVFEVLVDEVPRGRLGAGARLPLFLEAYRSYQLRLRPVAGSPVAYDPSPRTITLFPGNVEQVRWDAKPLVTVFGQAISSEGRPIGDASVLAAQGVGQSDANGYFEIDAARDDVLQFRHSDGRACNIPLAHVRMDGDYVRLGRVVCQ